MGFLDAFASLWGNAPPAPGARGREQYCLTSPSPSASSSPDAAATAPTAAYADPAHRFELVYPREWALEKDWGIEVASPCLGSFARADVVDEGDPLTLYFRRRVEEAGGRFELRHQCRGRSEHERGEIGLHERRFLWEAYGYPRAGRKVVLTRGLAIGDGRAVAARHYATRVLSEILKRFHVIPAAA